MIVGLTLGTGMVVAGVGLGIKNIWDAATKKAFANEKMMRKMVKNQEKQINELIEQNFDIMNNVKKNVDAIAKSTVDLVDNVFEIQQDIENKMKEVNNKVCEFVLSTNSMTDSINKDADTNCGDKYTKSVDAAEEVCDAADRAEEMLADAIVNAKIEEEKELAKACAEAIREEEEASSAKRYKSAKKGVKK